MVPDVAATLGGVQGPVFSAGTTNITGPWTNFGTFGFSNTYTSAESGSQYSITAPSNYALLGFDNFSPNVAGFVDGQTVWITGGKFSYRMLLLGTNQSTPVAFSSSLNCVTSVNSYSFYSFSNYAPGSLGYALATNITARTNAGRDGVLWDSISVGGWSWHTNSLIYGATGYTALSQMNTVVGDGFPWKFTAITRRHAYTAGHVFGAPTTLGKRVYFVGSDGSTVSMTVTNARSRFAYTPVSDDYCIVLFDQDLPATVTPVRVCASTNFQYKFPFNQAIANQRFTPSLETCQHGRVGSQQMPIFDSHVMHVGGDSGNPVFFLYGNEVINYGGTSGTLLSTTNFWNDLNALTTAAGLNTNDYQPVFFHEITNFMSYYP
jgi:hypothetical protein